MAVDRFDPFAAYAAYVAQRLANEPHVWAFAVFDEVVVAGYEGSYPTFTRKIRQGGLRPSCEPRTRRKVVRLR